MADNDIDIYYEGGAITKEDAQRAIAQLFTQLKRGGCEFLNTGNAARDAEYFLILGQSTLFDARPRNLGDEHEQAHNPSQTVIGGEAAFFSSGTKRKMTAGLPGNRNQQRTEPKRQRLSEANTTVAAQVDGEADLEAAIPYSRLATPISEAAASHHSEPFLDEALGADRESDEEDPVECVQQQLGPLPAIFSQRLSGEMSDEIDCE